MLVYQRVCKWKLLSSSIGCKSTKTGIRWNQNEWIGNSKESEWTWNCKKLARLAKGYKTCPVPSDFPSLIDPIFMPWSLDHLWHETQPVPPAPARTAGTGIHRPPQVSPPGENTTGARSLPAKPMPSACWRRISRIFSWLWPMDSTPIDDYI